MSPALLGCLAFGYGVVLGFFVTALWLRQERRRRLRHKQACRRLAKLREQARACVRVQAAVHLALLTGHSIYVQRPESWVRGLTASRS